MKSARERMDIIAAYREVGTTVGPRDGGTVKRVIARHEASGTALARAPRGQRHPVWLTCVLCQRMSRGQAVDLWWLG